VSQDVIRRLPMTACVTKGGRLPLRSRSMRSSKEIFRCAVVGKLVNELRRRSTSIGRRHDFTHLRTRSNHSDTI